MIEYSSLRQVDVMTRVGDQIVTGFRIRMAWVKAEPVRRWNGWASVPGWYLATIGGTASLGNEFAFGGGLVELHLTDLPHITTGDETVARVINNGVVMDGGVADQLIFDAMVKRVPMIFRKNKVDELIRRKVRL